MTISSAIWGQIQGAARHFAEPTVGQNDSSLKWHFVQGQLFAEKN